MIKQCHSWNGSGCPQLCLTLCDCMDCSPPGSSVHGISQARILERVVISSSRGLSCSRDWTCVSCVSCTGRQIFHHWASWEAHVYGKNYNLKRYMHTMFIAALFQFSCSVVSNSLWPHGLQHARLPCSSPTLRACRNSWPLSRWCHPTTSVKTRKQPKWPLTEEWINEMWYI